MDTVYDAIIVGGGPAGISAAINLAIRGKNFLIFGSPEESGVRLAGKVENYPGFESLSGKELIGKFTVHAESMGICFDRRHVQSVMKFGENFSVSADNEIFFSKTLLVATGAPSGNLFEGEAEFLGRGVSYCATCDGRFYRGKNIAVFCDSDGFYDDLSYLSSIAGKLYIIKPKKLGLRVPENTDIIESGKIKKIYGKERLEKIAVDDKDKDKSELDADCLFILRRSMRAESLVNGLETEEGFVKVDREMKTNIDGCFAGGDCTGRPFQFAKAVGDGNVAAHSMLAYLE